MMHIHFSDALPYAVIVSGAASLVFAALLPSTGPLDWTFYAGTISSALMCVLTLLWAATSLHAQIKRRKPQRS